jgi:hypothetical protein
MGTSDDQSLLRRLEESIAVLDEQIRCQAAEIEQRKRDHTDHSRRLARLHVLGTYRDVLLVDRTLASQRLRMDASAATDSPIDEAAFGTPFANTCKHLRTPGTPT